MANQSPYKEPLEDWATARIARSWVAVTPNDSTDLADMANALFVGVGGDIRITGDDGNDEVFKNVPDGFFLPCRVTRVYSTNTTATDIIALY
jgi:hypothetical protein